jgi:hypothetical protein
MMIGSEYMIFLLNTEVHKQVKTLENAHLKMDALSVYNGEHKSKSSSKHTQRNQELF